MAINYSHIFSSGFTDSIFFRPNLIGLKPLEQNRNSSFFGHELIFRKLSNKIFPIILAILVSKVIKLKNNSFTYIILPMFIVILLLTGERTASILGITFVLVSSLYIIENFKLKIIYLFSIMIIPAILIVLNPDLNKRFFQDTYNYLKSSNYNTYINTNQKQTNYAQDEKNLYLF